MQHKYGIQKYFIKFENQKFKSIPFVTDLSTKIDSCF